MFKATCITFVLLLTSGHQLLAGVFVPAGLNEGDTYQLIFATDGVHDGISADIAIYRAFAQSEAERNSNVTGTSQGINYFALAATRGNQSVAANAPISAPVYNLNGERVADNFTDMFDGSLDAAIGFDQFQTAVLFPELAWTGFDSAGTSSQFIAIGSTNGTGRAGLPSSTSGTWAFSVTRNPPTELRIYALSEPITVSAVPEPSSVALSGLAAIASLGVGLIRRWRKVPATHGVADFGAQATIIKS